MPGINLIGYFTGNVGLGVATRTVAELLERQGIEFCIVSLELEGRRAPEVDFAKFKRYFSSTPKYEINVFVFGADFANVTYPALKRTIDLDGKYNVFIPFWELYEYPERMLELKNEMHMFLAPSRFIQYSLMRVMDNARVEYLPPGLIHLPAAKPVADTEEKRPFRFFFNFDINSSMLRKNPEALLNVFQKTFGQDPDVELVLKVNGGKQGNGKQIADQIIRFAQGKRIRIITDFLSYDEMLDLISSADCYISCHRSEGLGLGLLEAMAIGIPCISTAFGGNTEFMNCSNALLLRHDLEPVTCNLYRGILGKEDRWASVKHDDLIHAMRKMRHDHDFRTRIAKNARHDAKQLLEAFWQTRAFQGVFEAYAIHHEQNRR